MAKARGVAVSDSWMLDHSFEFKAGEEPEGFKDIEIGDTVTITMTGKVSRLTEQAAEGSDDYQHSCITIRRKSVSISKLDGKPSLNSAVNKNRERRRA